QIALRVARLERGRRRRIETDVREENDCRALQYSATAEVTEGAGVGRHIRPPVGRVDVPEPRYHDDHDDGDLEAHHDRVGAGRATHSHVQQCGHGGDDQYRRHVDDGAGGDDVIVRVEPE